MSDLFTTSPSNLSGNVRSTAFVHSLINTDIPYDYVVWHTGDGTYFYDQPTITHRYQYPGTFNVSVTAGNFQETTETQTTQVTADLIAADYIEFTNLPSTYAKVGQQTASPFTIKFYSSQIIEQATILLYSSNSNSAPHKALNNAWSFLIPTWRFLDADTKEIVDSKTITPNFVYEGSTVVGVSGEYSFFYVDDSSTGANPVTLHATLLAKNFKHPNEQKYSSVVQDEINSDISAKIEWHIEEAQVTNYKITENYLNDIYPTKWANVPIPVMITCLWAEQINGNTNFYDVKEYPKTNDIGQNNPINLVLYKEDGSLVPSEWYTTESPLYFKNTDSKGNKTPGFIFTTITPLTAFPYKVKVGIQNNNTDFSSLFSVYFSNKFTIAKINESFDFSGYMQSLFLPEHTKESIVDLSSAFDAIVGNGDVKKEHLGRVYERIANFTENHADPDTAEIKNILDFATQLSVECKDYFVEAFPYEIKRLLNLLSIPKHRLAGVSVYDNKNILDYISERLTTETSLISAGQELIVKDKRYDSYFKLTVSPGTNEERVYPLSELNAKQLRTPIMENYYIYTLDQKPTGYIQNMIDWDSEHTNLTIDSLSSYDEWYKDGGIVDTMFNDLLTKQLIADN